MGTLKFFIFSLYQIEKMLCNKKTGEKKCGKLTQQEREKEEESTPSQAITGSATCTVTGYANSLIYMEFL